MKHFLSLEDHSVEDLEAILDRAAQLKSERKRTDFRPLDRQTWGLLFAKSSTRTRVSFEVGIHELGGRPLFLNMADLQSGRGEPISDTARVLGRMIDGAVIRTYEQQDLLEFADRSRIPTINALTDQEHPCQIMADLLTIREKLGTVREQTVAFIGDGAGNMAASWIAAAKKFGFGLRIAAPRDFWPKPTDGQPPSDQIILTSDPAEAARGADVLYTDVWVSMGMEAEAEEREERFRRYQINRETIAATGKSPLVMHCLPAYRGKEISEETLEDHQQTIFDQAENRLHAQKGIICWLLNA